MYCNATTGDDCSGASGQSPPCISAGRVPIDDLGSFLLQQQGTAATDNSAPCGYAGRAPAPHDDPDCAILRTTWLYYEDDHRVWQACKVDLVREFIFHKQMGKSDYFEVPFPSKWWHEWGIAVVYKYDLCKMEQSRVHNSQATGSAEVIKVRRLRLSERPSS
jgi:hypothetical protein